MSDFEAVRRLVEAAHIFREIDTSPPREVTDDLRTTAIDVLLETARDVGGLPFFKTSIYGEAKVRAARLIAASVLAMEVTR